MVDGGGGGDDVDKRIDRFFFFPQIGLGRM